MIFKKIAANSSQRLDILRGPQTSLEVLDKMAPLVVTEAQMAPLYKSGTYQIIISLLIHMRRFSPILRIRRENPVAEATPRKESPDLHWQPLRFHIHGRPHIVVMKAILAAGHAPNQPTKSDPLLRIFISGAPAQIECSPIGVRVSVKRGLVLAL